MKRIKASAVKTPNLAFKNETLTTDVISHRSTLGYALKSIDLLHGAVDAKVNGYSALVLSDKKNIENSISIKNPNIRDIQLENIDADKAIRIVTDIQAKASVDAQPKSLFLMYIESDGIEMGWASEPNNFTQFLLEFMDSSHMSISFFLGESRLFLNTAGKFTDTPFHFEYIWNKDSGALCLIAPGSEGDILTCDVTSSLQIGTVKHWLPKNITLFGGTFPASSVLKVRAMEETATPDVSIHWNEFEKSYEKSATTVSLKSLSGVDASFLVDMAYNSATEDLLQFGLIQTKDMLDRTHIQGRTSYSLKGDAKDEINYRQYTGIFSGSDEEGGYTAPLLSYVSQNASILCKAGKSTKFVAPSDMGVFESLNINDTTFFECGAIGGETPLLSDKVYKRLSNYTSNIKDDATGAYLCTWLYNPGNGDDAIWLDRYYNPLNQKTDNALLIGVGDVITEQESIINKAVYQEALTKNGFFDKKSDLAIEPDAEYLYYRLSEDFFSRYTEVTLKDRFLIDEVDIQPSTTFFNQSMENYASGLTVNIAVERKDWSTTLGHTVFSNKNGDGVALLSDAYKTIFIAVNRVTSVDILDTKLERIINIPASLINPGNSISFVHFHNPTDMLLVFFTSGDFMKVSLEGAVRERGYNVALAGNLISGTTYDRTTDAVVVSKTDGSAIGINWLNLSSYALPSTPKSIAFAGKKAHLASGHLYIDGVEFKTGAIALGSVLDVSTDRDDNLIIMSLLGGQRFVSIFDNNQLFKSSFDVPNTTINISTINIEQENFVLLQTDVSLIKVTYLGAVVRTLTGSFGASVLSAIGIIKKYFNSASTLDLTLDFRFTRYSDNGASVVHDTFTVKADKLSKGTHYISFTLDGINGTAKLYVNGFLLKDKTFEKNVFIFPNGFRNEYVIGSPRIGAYTKTGNLLPLPLGFRVSKATFPRFSLINGAIDHTSVVALNKRDSKIPDIRIQLPFAFRSEIEEISTIYKMGVPGRKDSRLRVKISGIKDLKNNEELIAKIDAALNKENPLTTEISSENA